MMKTMIFALFMLKTTVFGADWARVIALRAGEPVRVETASGKQTGHFVAATDDTLRFAANGGAEISVARPEVKSVYARSKSHRVRNTIIGAAIGVAAGAVIYGTLGALFRNETNDETGYMLAVPIAVGTAVGAALPTGSMKKIYDVK